MNEDPLTIMTALSDGKTIMIDPRYFGPGAGKAMTLSAYSQGLEPLRGNSYSMVFVDEIVRDHSRIFTPLPPSPQGIIAELQRKAQRGDRQAQRDLMMAQKKLAAQKLTAQFAPTVETNKKQQERLRSMECPDWGQF